MGWTYGNLRPLCPSAAGKPAHLLSARGNTQAALGLLAECEPSYVGRIERGAENPSVDLLEALASALGEHIGTLFYPAAEGQELLPGLTPGRKPST